MKTYTVDRVQIHSVDIRITDSGLDLIAGGAQGNEDGKVGGFSRPLTLTTTQRNQLVALLETLIKPVVADELGTNTTTHEIVRNAAIFVEQPKA